MKILIVDDSPILRERLKCMLAGIPGVMNITEAKDGLDAIEISNIFVPDVVILDMHMPRVNGIETLKYLKGNEPSPIVIILTNCTFHQYRAICMHEGADFFFYKTSEYNKIPEVIKWVLGFSINR